MLHNIMDCHRRHAFIHKCRLHYGFCVHEPEIEPSRANPSLQRKTNQPHM